MLEQAGMHCFEKHHIVDVFRSLHREVKVNHNSCYIDETGSQTENTENEKLFLVVIEMNVIIIHPVI